MSRIKELREAAGLTLEQVADKIGTTFQQVQRLETGKRRLTEAWMVRLAGPLGVKPHNLMASSVAVPGEREFANDELEVLLLNFWRRLETLAEKKVVLRGMCPPGETLPSFLDEPSPQRKRA